MADRSTITPELCRQLLRYEPETGRLFWLLRPVSMFNSQRACNVWNSRYAGREAFTAVELGYRVGRILDMGFKAHRVGWVLTHGAWPPAGFDVDHINGDRSDNRIVNLRAAPHQENGRNMKRASTNSSGRTGVSFNTTAERWEAYIGDRDTRQRLGQFMRFEDACTAREAAERRHGYHPNHGR